MYLWLKLVPVEFAIDVQIHCWVIANQFSKSLQVTPSELDETWFVSSTCGYMKPDKILLSYVVWLPDYRFNFFPIFAAVATIQILITFPYLIVL